MRTQKEIATYRGHNRDVTCAAWHPLHEELFASGGYDGSLMFWLVSDPEPQVMLTPHLRLCCPSPWVMLPLTTSGCACCFLTAAFMSTALLLLLGDLFGNRDEVTTVCHVLLRLQPLS